MSLAETVTEFSFTIPTPEAGIVVQSAAVVTTTSGDGVETVVGELDPDISTVDNGDGTTTVTLRASA